MRAFFSTLLAAAVMAAPGAEAQNARAGSYSNSGASAMSGSQSAGGSASVTTSLGANQGVYVDQRGQARTRSDINYSGDFDQRTVPGVIAPALAAGVNSCAVSASVGGSVLGTGITGGAAWSDKSCERRAEAAALAGLGYPKLAMRHLARDPEVYQTLVDAGVITQVATVSAPPENVRPRKGQIVAGGYTRPSVPSSGYTVCSKKDNRTVVTDASTMEGKMACAKSLGMR